MKKITQPSIVLYCLPLFAVGLFTTMLNNYLIYFYQPTAASGLPILITQGYVFAGILTVIGLIKAVGHVIDAVSDPMVAALSDKSGHRDGRRIPFLRRYAVPFALCALLIFCSPFQSALLNDIWLAVFIWAYYIFYTLYMVPHGALLPEMVRDEGLLVDSYTYHSLFFVVGSMLGYATPAIVSLIKKTGVSPRGSVAAYLPGLYRGGDRPAAGPHPGHPGEGLRQLRAAHRAADGIPEARLFQPPLPSGHPGPAL